VGQITHRLWAARIMQQRLYLAYSGGRALTERAHWAAMERALQMTMTKHRLQQAVLGTALAAAVTATLGGVATAQTTTRAANAVIHDPNGQTVGTATLTETTTGLRVVLQGRGLPPGAHGLHVHAVGQCEVWPSAPPAERENPDTPTGGAFGRRFRPG